MERLKIVLLGSICVGKTSIIDQYIRNGFYELFEKTIVADKSIKEIVLSDGKKIDLEIWDTPGSKIYISVSKHCLKNAKIVLLIYDITDKRSFEELNYFYNDICEVNEKENIFFCVVANKCDLYEDQIISSELGKKYANTINALFFEASATDNENIEYIFKEIVNEYFNF